MYLVSHHLDKPDPCFRTAGEETVHIAKAHAASLPPAIRIIASNWSNSGTAPYGPSNVALRVAHGSAVARLWSAAVEPIWAEMANATSDIAVTVIG